MNDTVPTKYWHRLEDGRIQCDLCPRYCKLREDQRGMCFVRACQNQQIVLTTYGRSSGFCVDPIEKKPLNHFLPGTPVLSFGTAGCNLACRFCQNWDISKSRETDTLADSASPETIARAAKELNCRSVAFTYNDPVIFHEYAIDVPSPPARSATNPGSSSSGTWTRQTSISRRSPNASTTSSVPGTCSPCWTRSCT
jgi:pyruvate formate lyase activating enzyme